MRQTLEDSVSTLDKAKEAQLSNIEARLGSSLAAIRAEVAGSGKVKHGEVRGWLIERYGLGYGDANALAHAARSDATAVSDRDDPLEQIYSGKKEHLRAIHDALLERIASWGPFEVAPKKGYVALRRKKQFAMLGPKNAAISELGINLKDEIAGERIVRQKAGGMCQYAVALDCPDDLDQELLAVLRRAFDAAG